MGRYIQPTVQEFDSNGDPLSGGKLYFYTTGTLTAKDTYSDLDLTTANTNPVVADAGGRFGDIFLEAGTYRVILKDSDDVTIYDRDPVEGPIGSSGAVDELTGDYAITVSDASKILACDASGGAFTITLLAAATAGEGFEITVKKTDSDETKAVTIDGDGSETIDGSTTFAITEQNQAVTLRCDGANWQIASAHPSVGSAGEVFTTDGSKMLWSPGAPFKYVAGFVPSNGTDTDHDIDFTAGVIRYSDDSAAVKLASALTKQFDAAFAKGTNQGGLGDSVSLPASGTMHFFAITQDSTGDVDIYGDTAYAGSNVPSGWTVVGRIGSLTTTAGSIFTQVITIEREGGAIDYRLKVPVGDVNDSATGTSAKTGTLANVPTGRAFLAHTIFNHAFKSATSYLLITALSQTDTAPGSSAYNSLINTNGPLANAYFPILTDSSAQFRYRTSADAALGVITHGWVDTRR